MNSEKNTKKRVVVVVQARMGSSRLPNKMLLHLNGIPIIEWIYERVRKSKESADCVFAIPDTPKDTVLGYYLEKLGADTFVGSEDDVLGRFYLAAKEHAATHVVRVCADNPCICPDEIDNLIRFYFSASCDYAYNHIPRNNTYPDGLGAEMVSFDLLEMLHKSAKDRAHREHIFNYIWDNSSEFSINTFDPAPSLAYPDIKLDIDNADDYLKMMRLGIHAQMSSEEIVAKYKAAFGIA